jgi:plasmid stabilization system protein ParE
MKRVHRPEVDREVRAAAVWYDRQRQGLGDAFLRVVRSTLEELVEHPHRFPTVHKDIRRVLTPKPFPYQVLYFLDERRQQIVVLAIVDQARDPKRWQGRRLRGGSRAEPDVPASKTTSAEEETFMPRPNSKDSDPLSQKASGTSAPKESPHRFHDLDHLAGTWTAEEAAHFEEVLDQQRRIDEASTFPEGPRSRPQC